MLEEHRNCEKEIDLFEKALHAIPETGITKETDAALRRFFRFFDESVNAHNLKEEKKLFPLLQKHLLKKGEHSNGPEKVTAITMFEEDHLKSIQLTAITFNFFGLVSRLPDPKSRLMVLDAALEQGKALVELLRLHIFREENIAFPLAHQSISENEFDLMKK